MNYPDVCTNETVPGQAFCEFHCQLCKNQTPPVPTKLRDFLKYAGVFSDDDKDLSKMEPNEGDEQTRTFHVDHSYASSVISEQSGQEFLNTFSAASGKITKDCVLEGESRCSKDMGERKTLRKMSRGHQFIVRAGGHIDMWTPLYQSESLGQVFLFLLSWLLPPSSWNSLWVAYDNMCQLMKLKAAKADLSLPYPYNKMWSSINKIIDALHLKNHVDVECQTKLNPSNIVDMYPELEKTKNTQAAEQTFVWLGRYKKILCSMPKTHHLFYLHRLVKRRNCYTAQRYKVGRKPLLPGIRNEKST